MTTTDEQGEGTPPGAPRSGWRAEKPVPLAFALAAYGLTLLVLALPAYRMNGWPPFLYVIFVPGRPLLGDLGMLVAVVALWHRGCLVLLLGWAGIVWWALTPYVFAT